MPTPSRHHCANINTAAMRAHGTALRQARAMRTPNMPRASRRRTACGNEIARRHRHVAERGPAAPPAYVASLFTGMPSPHVSRLPSYCREIGEEVRRGRCRHFPSLQVQAVQVLRVREERGERGEAGEAEREAGRKRGESEVSERRVGSRGEREIFLLPRLRAEPASFPPEREAE